MTLRLAGALAALLCAAATRAVPLDEYEQRGRRIYFNGIGTNGLALLAVVGEEARPIDGQATACVNCHGEDGLGRDAEPPAPAVSWQRLVRPHAHPDGRDHPPFEPLSLGFALGSGIDPGGSPMHPAMPRYQLTTVDVHCLFAYLRRIETDRDPGVEAGSLVVGTVVPADGAADGPGAVIHRVVEAWVAEVNEGGGIHGRTLRLAVAAYDPARPGAALAAATRLVAEERVFALVSGFTPGAEEAVAELALREGVPLVGPFTPVSREATPPNRFVFHLLAGPAEQARALAEHAVRRGEGSAPAAVLHGDDPHLGAAAQAAARHFEARGWTGVEVVGYGAPGPDAALVARLKERGAGVVVFLGPDADLAALLRAADAAGFAPQVLAPGTLAGRAALGAPRSFQGRIFLGYPFAPTDEAPAAAKALARLRTRAGVGERHRAAQVSAFTATALLGECLKRAGRALSREALVIALEGLWAWEPGLVPPLTYGASRRVGAHGAHVVGVDLDARTVRPVGWVAVP